MSDRLLPTETVVVLGLIVVVPLVLWIGWRRHDAWRPALLRLAFAVYLMVIIGLLFSPLPLPPWTALPDTAVAAGDRPWPFPWVNIVPFETIRGALRFGVEWQPGRHLVGNVLVFAPFGIFLPMLWPRWRSLVSIVVAALAISLAVESAQLGVSLLIGFPFRVADIDDILLNVVGIALGYTVYRAIVVILPGRRSFAGAP
jgi:glycopeptide antibiotics resistance protein